VTERRVRWLATAGSTNDELRDLARQGAPHGTAVATDHQTAGRGRHARVWEMPPGAGLALSLLVRTPLPPRHVPLVGFAAAIATADACGSPFVLKWPNDVLAPDGRKIAGILAEAEWEGSAPAYVVVGIGINVHAAPDLPTATSLAAVIGSPPSVHDLAETITDATLARCEQLREDPRSVLDAWRARARLGMAVRMGAVEGIAEDVDDDGALLVRGARGARVRVVAGDLEPIAGW
jgi:BirA family biotin operon repressor/biotin-[acetyl-CoA-carboxylase] ligase